MLGSVCVVLSGRLSLHCKMDLITHHPSQIRRQAQGAIVTIREQRKFRPCHIKLPALPMASLAAAEDLVALRGAFEQTGFGITVSGQVCRAVGNNEKQAS